MERIQPCHLITIPGGGRLNCGLCEKCLRTKLSLLSLGLPISPLTFHEAALDPRALFRFPLVSPTKVDLFQPLVAALWRQGSRRLAMVLAVRLLLARLRLAVRPPRW